jgi:uncharacterized oxidoreductase
MKITGQTILITGGSKGIGLAMARHFSELGNTVIITARNREQLEKAAAPLKSVAYFACDVTNENDVDALVQLITQEVPHLSMLINNAGQAYAYRLSDPVNIFERGLQEMKTNYLSVVRLTQKLLPVLQKQQDPAIINMSSIAAVIPSGRVPTYSSSKAALHSYTQNLRLMLEGRVKVFEIFPPLVNTDFSREIGGEKGIPPQVVAEQLAEGLKNDQYEIFVAAAASLYQLHRTGPMQALQLMNAGVNE